MRSKPKGFSLFELLMAMALFSLLVVFSVAFLSQGQRVWGRINASDSAGRTLRKGAEKVSRDLANAGREGVASAANGTGASRMGDALWMLSAEDTASGRFVRSPEGAAFWQRNILFYLTVPLDHDVRYGVACQSWGRVCPHKILLRKVIDSGAPTLPASPPEDVETLIAPLAITAYLTRPASLDLSTISSEPGVVSVDYVSGHLLDSRVTLETSGTRVTEASCVLEAAMVEDARHRLEVGRDPFPPVLFTLSRRIGVVPIN
jgi:prepilin-type N-terminal cleavage/methylation domain-containing protein